MTQHERAIEYAEGDADFAAWLSVVDAECLERVGLSIFDFEDVCWRDLYRDLEDMPSEAFAYFAEEVGIAGRIGP